MKPRVLCFLASVFFSLHALAAVELTFAPSSELKPAGTLVLPLQKGRSIADDNGHLSRDVLASLNTALAAAEFKADAGSGITLYAQGKWNKVIVIGMGDEEITPRQLRNFGGSAAQLLADDALASIYWTSLPTDEDTPAAHIALGVQLGGYRFDKYFNPDLEEDEKENETEGAVEAKEITILSSNAKVAAEYYRREWQGLAKGIVFARDLVNEPANAIYPQSFVERTEEAFKGVKNVSIEVLDAREMSKLGMGALLGVGMGSARPPRLLVVNYQGGKRDEPPVVLAGKGVTFDSGGISIKPANGMWEMKYDMAGAAVVTATALAVAQREAPMNLVAISALVENMPSHMAQRPGDVRKTLCGKTIEIINTDSEGRLILADAVCYAQQEFEPKLIVDVATLTGSAKAALGTTYAALFTRDDKLARKAIAAGKTSGEELWRLPLHKDYQETIKSKIADVRNLATTYNAGASTGAHFIGSFIEEDVPWIHLDIAGMAWAYSASPTVPEGASGWGILLLNRLLQDNYE
jgi:leucyl aminopeptidase